MANSRPCYNCLEMMKAVGIRKVYYSDNKGNIVCESVKDMISIQASIVAKIIYNLDYPGKIITWENYFENLLKRLFPSKIKKINFDNFIKYNLVNVLPDFSYTIEKENNINIITIKDSFNNKVLTSILI
jgi:hypothetical protein